MNTVVQSPTAVGPSRPRKRHQADDQHVDTREALVVVDADVEALVLRGVVLEEAV